MSYRMNIDWRRLEWLLSFTKNANTAPASAHTPMHLALAVSPCRYEISMISMINFGNSNILIPKNRPTTVVNENPAFSTGQRLEADLCQEVKHQ